VPLEWTKPEGAKIKIYFELYSHTNSGPAESAILMNPGGPGVSITYYRDIALTWFSPNLDAHDILLIDDRGRGLSTTIECAELQLGTAPFPQAEADCVGELKNAPSAFGTGAIAQDTDAVRAALGYNKLDYWGASYGGEDVIAYATRFGEHLRSIVLDAPEGAPGLDAFQIEGVEAHSTLREIRLLCLRSPTCAIDHPHPDPEFARLINTLRNQSLRGQGYDANGNLVSVELDEGGLLYLIGNYSGNFVNIGELLAAGDSLSAGDLLPLLRLGAEVPPFIRNYGDPTALSQGSYLATLCVDLDAPWDWSVPMAERYSQYNEAVEGLSSDFFAPFSKMAGTSLAVSSEHQCLWWQKSTQSSPVLLPGAKYPNVPTLAMAGDLDTLVPLEESSMDAAFFSDSTFIPVAEAGHITALWTQCAVNIQSHFFETLEPGDISCTKTPETVWPAVGRFPRVAADAHPAEIDASRRNQIEEGERKVVTVAVAAAIDALKRSSIGSGTGLGLRAGIFETVVDSSGNQTTTLSNCAFSQDVIVNGVVKWNADKTLFADLVVSGSGTKGGSLHVEGAWEAPGPVGDFKVSGTLGGDNVAVLIPEA
jgi:pimeloyl-ACP methyl ester carboxylesterase